MDESAQAVSTGVICFSRTLSRARAILYIATVCLRGYLHPSAYAYQEDWLPYLLLFIYYRCITHGSRMTSRSFSAMFCNEAEEAWNNKPWGCISAPLNDWFIMLSLASAVENFNSCWYFLSAGSWQAPLGLRGRLQLAAGLFLWAVWYS